jgi:TRAP-type C4-dicarboxylate transport system permease small subunit
VEKIGEWNAWLSHKFAFSALVAMFAIIMIEVLLRLFLGISTMVAHEYSAYLLIFFVFSSLAEVTQKNRHIKILMITSRLPPKLANPLEVVMISLTLLVIVYMFYWSLDMTVTSIKNFERAETVSGTPLAVPKAFIPFGLSMFIIQLVVLLTQRIKNINVAQQIAPAEDVLGKSGQQL